MLHMRAYSITQVRRCTVIFLTGYQKGLSSYSNEGFSANTTQFELVQCSHAVHDVNALYVMCR